MEYFFKTPTPLFTCGRAKTGAFDVIVSYSACSVKAGFTSDGVRVRSVRPYDLMTTASWFRLRLRRLRWSENKVVGVVSRSGTTKPITFKRVNPERSLWFVYPTIWFSPDVNDGVINRVGKKWKRSESFDPTPSRLSYESAYDSKFWFLKGHERSSDSASVASENQPNIRDAMPNLVKILGSVLLA